MYLLGAKVCSLELASPLLLVVHEAEHGKAKQGNEEGCQQIDISLEDGFASSTED